MVDQGWIVEVRHFDGVERAQFETRGEALEHARAIIGDYKNAVSVTLRDPSGKAETLQRSALLVPDGTH